MKTLPIVIMSISMATILLSMISSANMDAKLLFTNKAPSEINFISLHQKKPYDSVKLIPLKTLLLSSQTQLTGSESPAEHINNNISEVSLATAQANLSRVYLSGKHVPDEGLNRLTNTYTF